jgi:hypothetical protein
VPLPATAPTGIFLLLFYAQLLTTKQSLVCLLLWLFSRSIFLFSSSSSFGLKDGHLSGDRNIGAIARLLFAAVKARRLIGGQND